MGQKTDFIFDSLYNPGTLDPEDTKLDNEHDEVLMPESEKLKENKELKKENDIEVNGNSYHITF